MSFSVASAWVVPKVSLTCNSATDFGARPVSMNSSFCSRNASEAIIGPVGKLRNTVLKRPSVIAGAAATLTTSGMPFCSHTCAAAVVAPES